MARKIHLVVVGGGIVGLSIARALAGRGARVTVLEKRYPAAEATSASFAWLNNQAYFRNADRLEEPAARHYFMLHRLALGAWHRVEQDIGDVGIRWGGVLAWCWPGAEDEPQINGELARRQRWGGPATRVDESDIVALVPHCVPGPVGAAFYGPDEGSIDPAVAVSALAGACIRLGVEIRWPCAAQCLVVTGDRVTGVDTGDEVIDCDAVIVAAGVDTPSLANQVGIKVPLVESKGAIVHLAPLPLLLDPVVLAPAVHAVQRQDGRLAIARHFAGTPVVEGVEVDTAVVLETASELFPMLRRAKLERVTVGSRILPADGLPIIGRNPDVANVVCLATNAGVSLGPLLAELLCAQVIDGADVDLLAPYDASRFDS